MTRAEGFEVCITRFRVRTGSMSIDANFVATRQHNFFESSSSRALVPLESRKTVASRCIMHGWCIARSGQVEVHHDTPSYLSVLELLDGFVEFAHSHDRGLEAELASPCKVQGLINISQTAD